MGEQFLDYLTDKPFSIVFWDISPPFDSIQDAFKDTIIKIVSSLQEVENIMKMEKVKNLVIAIYDEEKWHSLKSILDRLLPEQRRELFIILIKPNVKTFDPLETFIYSVNLLVNIEDLKFFPELYKKSLEYWETLYKNYKKFYSQILESF